MRLIAAALLWLGLSLQALAQSTPGLIFGQIPTNAQWNSYFAAKQDYLGVAPLLSTGGLLTGKLTTAISSATGGAGLNCAPGVTPNSPINGDIWCTPIGLFYQNGAPVGPLTVTPGVNIVARFGSMDVWQRGAGGSASFTVPANTTSYTVDGCYMSTQPNGAGTVAQVAGIALGSVSAAQVSRNSGQTDTVTLEFGCPLDTDELALVRGQYVTMSLTFSTGANYSATAANVDFLCGTGSPIKFVEGYTNTTIVISIPGVLGTNQPAQRIQGTSQAVVPTNCSQAEILASWNPTGTAGANDNFTIDDIQLEVVPGPSSVATPYQHLDFNSQLMRAQRHYAKTFAYGTAPANSVGANTGEIQSIAGKATTGVDMLQWRYPRQMRIVPSITTYNPSANNAQVRDETVPGDTSSTATPNLTADAVTVTASGNGSSAVGNILGVHVAADAGIP